MHEAYLFISLIREIEENIKPHQPCRVTKILLRVGKYSGLDLKYLSQVIALYKEDSLLQGAQILLEEDNLRVYCPRCHLENDCAEPKARCPLCGSREVKITGGLDLYLQSIEIEKDED